MIDWYSSRPNVGLRTSVHAAKVVDLNGFSGVIELEGDALEMTIVGLSEEVKQLTIEIRRKYRLKLHDAIVCATAIILDSNST